jgi:hypothetical protein
VSSGCNEVRLLQPSGIWTMERCEPQQFWRLKRRLIDLIDKKRKLENQGKSMKTKDSIEYVGVGLQLTVTYTYIGSRT